jgi:hypothetical protein
MNKDMNIDTNMVIDTQKNIETWTRTRPRTLIWTWITNMYTGHRREYGHRREHVPGKIDGNFMID